MKIINFTKHNPQYKEYNIPEEDSFRFLKDKGRVLVTVADGITRDSFEVRIRPDNNDKEAMKEAFKKYPRPSPAKKAADLFCKSFIEYFKNKKEINGSEIKEAFEFANKKIEELNKEKNPFFNYLENDFWACVASAGVIVNKELYYGFIADCGVCVFDSKGKLKSRTKDEGPNAFGNIDEDILKKYNTSFKFPEGRKIIRSIYRNNPLNPLSYGALTGEKNAVGFVRRGKFQLQTGDYVVFYSDGMVKILYSDEFNISKSFDSLEKYFENNLHKLAGGEGTIVAVKIE